MAEKEFSVNSQEKRQLIDITSQVEEIVANEGSGRSAVLVFVPHSTAAILITENEAGLKKDWLSFFSKLTEGIAFEHNKIDDNGEAHILSGAIGQGKVLPIEDGRLVRGTWQNIFLAEFDGPRLRKVVVRII